jgi:hypothetical protein
MNPLFDSKPEFRVSSLSKSPRKSRDDADSMRDPLRFAAMLQRHTPRNLQEVASALDIGPDNAPQNIYNQPTMQRMMQQLK